MYTFILLYIYNYTDIYKTTTGGWVNDGSFAWTIYLYYVVLYYSKW